MTMPAAEHEEPARRSMGGVKAGAIVLVGVVLANSGNYVFQVIAARYLGPSPYGDLATLLVLGGLIGLPLGGLQVWVARHVAEYEAVGDREATRWFIRRVLLYTSAVAAGATVLFVALSPVIRDLLGISTLSGVAVNGLITIPAVVTPVVWGLAQGLQRFSLISFTVASAPIVRIALAAMTFGLGFGVTGAIAATLVSNSITLLFPLWILRSWLVPAPAPHDRIQRGEAVRSLLPVLLGLLAITALTSVDVIVAKAALGKHQAGIYGSASLIGRVILYLPTAIITVLLPRVAARAARDEHSLDILGLSALVTLAFCTVATLFYAAVPDEIVKIAFGAKYAEAAPLLWRFGVSMTGFALLNVLLVYDLGRRGLKVAWLLAAGAAAQIVTFLALHGSDLTLVDIDVVFAVLLLIAHEVLTRGTLIRAGGAGVKALARRG